MEARAPWRVCVKHGRRDVDSWSLKLLAFRCREVSAIGKHIM